VTTVKSPEDITLGGGAVPPAVSVDLPGTRLAQARQAMGLSVGDIAAKLRMSVQQIDAIERGDYSRLPKGTFLRGFVRSYAKLVALDPEAVLKLLEETHADSRRPEIVVPTQNIKMTVPGEAYGNTRSRSLLILALLAAVAGGIAYWWFEVRPGQSERLGRTPVKVSVQSVAVEPATAPAPAASSAPATDAAIQPNLSASTNGATSPALPAVGPNPSSTPESPPAPIQQAAPLTQTTAPLAPLPVSKAGTEASATPAKPAVPKGSGSLRFTFTGESWVEVVEASGKTIMSRRFQSGQGETVVGKLPVSVVIGNATVTKLQFNDVDFDLTPHTRVSVARFTLK
jgi:cytoskeleton protein RodZ